MAQLQHLQHQQQRANPLGGILSTVGGIAGTAVGGPMGGMAGSALGGAVGGQDMSTITQGALKKGASAGVGSVIGDALDTGTAAIDDALTTGEITDMAGGAAQVQQAPLAGPFGADPLRGYGQDQLPDYMQANQGGAMYANTGGPVPNANGTPSNSKFNYSTTDMNTPNQLVEGFQYGPLASVEYKKTGGKVGESYKMSYHNPLSATKQSKG